MFEGMFLSSLIFLCIFVSNTPVSSWFEDISWYSFFYDERPVTLFFDTPGINVRLSEGSGDLTKNDRGWTIVVPIGGPPGPEISIYAIDDAGQYSEYLKFKVPDNEYDCPYED